MAKRKRLTPANPMFFDSDSGETVPVSAPIANVVAEASATAALAEMSDSLVRARAKGRMVVPVPLDKIDLDYLMRDRLPVQDPEMEALVSSLRARGQRIPVELTPPNGAGRYGLISGWRRCVALARLRDETGDGQYDTVLALLHEPAQSSDAYLAMIEENEIRAGLSFYERARIVARTVESGVYASQTEALNALFAAASKAKKSKIRSFIGVAQALDGHLRFPQTIGERQGLKLARALGENSALAPRLCAALDQEKPETPEAEQVVIDRALTAKSGTNKAQKPISEGIAPGITAQLGRSRLTLSGVGLTPEIQARLVALLRRELKQK